MHWGFYVLIAVVIVVVAALITWVVMSYDAFERYLPPGSEYTIGGRQQRIPYMLHMVYKTEQVPTYDRPVPILREQILIDLRAIMMDTFVVLRGMDVPFWCCAGTLLSAVRWRQLMSYDDDCDLAVDWGDREKLFRNDFKVRLNAVNLERITLVGQGHDYANEQGALLRIRRIGTYHPTIDIAFCKDKPNGEYAHASGWDGDEVSFPKIGDHIYDTYDDRSWVYPIVDVEIDGFIWPLPNKPELLLTRAYGADNATTMKSPQPMTMSHKFAFWISDLFGTWSTD
jgi:hypothetical protein